MSPGSGWEGNIVTGCCPHTPDNPLDGRAEDESTGADAPVTTSNSLPIPATSVSPFFILRFPFFARHWLTRSSPISFNFTFLTLRICWFCHWSSSSVSSGSPVLYIFCSFADKNPVLLNRNSTIIIRPIAFAVVGFAFIVLSFLNNKNYHLERLGKRNICQSLGAYMHERFNPFAYIGFSTRFLLNETSCILKFQRGDHRFLFKQSNITIKTAIYHYKNKVPFRRKERRRQKR